MKYFKPGSKWRFINKDSEYNNCIVEVSGNSIHNGVVHGKFYPIGPSCMFDVDCLCEFSEEELKSQKSFKENCLDKDTLFMSMACLIGMASKDPSTKVGAVIVGQDDEVISVGFNGFPRKVYDLDESRYQKPNKYSWIEHAERNAIFNAARIGISCKNSRIYVPFHPCPDCVRGIIQAGIREVIIHKTISKLLSGSITQDIDSKLIPSKVMLIESGVGLREIDIDIPDIIITASGEKYHKQDIYRISGKNIKC